MIASSQAARDYVTDTCRGYVEQTGQLAEPWIIAEVIAQELLVERAKKKEHPHESHSCFSDDDCSGQKEPQ